MIEAMPQDKIFTAVYCRDKPGADIARIRQEVLAEHLAHIERTIDDILLAGPLFSPDGKSVTGSLLIYKAASREAAQAMLEADPYFKADIWQEITFDVLYGAAGDAVGGLAFKEDM